MAEISGGAGEGNRTLVFSLGRLTRSARIAGNPLCKGFMMREQLANESTAGKAVTAGLPHGLLDVIDDISLAITPLMRSFGYRELPDLGQHRRWVCQRMDAYTYFAQGKWTGRVKIGRSNDPWRRVHELIRAANGEESDLLVVQPSESLEGFYHRAFAPFAVGNEWFSPHPDILAEIERLRHPLGSQEGGA